MYRTASLAFALLGLVLPACGGGGGGDDSLVFDDTGALDFVRILLPEADLDGLVRSDGVVETTGTCGFVGDLDGPRGPLGATQFLAFDIAAIPSGAVIDSAMLSMYQQAVVGDPYSSHGGVIVSHVDIGPTLDASDYWIVPIEREVGILSADAALAYKSVDVTTAVRRSVAAASGRVDFALAWSRSGYSNNDGNPDFAMFNDGEDACGSGNRPHLTISYRVP